MKYIIITQSIITIIVAAIVILNIEKHSVHPVYGDYPQKAFGCEPWDSCIKKK